MIKNKANIIKGISSILLYLFGSTIISIIVLLIGIDITKLSNLNKQLFLIVCDLFITFILLYINKKDIMPNFKSFIKNIKLFFNKYFKYWFLMLGLMTISSLIITMFTTTNVSNNQSTILEYLNKYPIYILICTIITGPITEELIFRLSIKKLIHNDKLFIILSGLIFGSMHVLGSITNPIDLLFIIPYSIPGFIFAYLYNKTNNIFVPTGLHIIHNTVMILLQILTI